MANEKLLIVEDEKLIRWSIREMLTQDGYNVLEAVDGKEALACLSREDCDLVLLDYRLPDITGMEILEWVHNHMPEVSVVMMTAYGSVETAVRAMKLGVYDYLTKPVNLSELSVIVGKALETTCLRRELRRLRNEQASGHDSPHIIGSSPAMREVLDLVEKLVLRQTTTVLLEGESGTGKNLVANAIHYGGARADRPFVTVTCSAITETLLESELFGHERGAFTDAKVQKKGLLEMADGGTAFLDEIGDMGTALQAKLLRFLEDRTIKRVGGTRDIQVDVRVIAATNRDLAQAVRQGRFREDLYYRLKVIPIVMPSLRERREDIPLLVQYFLDKFNREFHKNTRMFTPAAMACLTRHPWPGNIRELKNMVERVMILEDKDVIELDDLPDSVSGRPQGKHAGAGHGAAAELGSMTLAQIEKEAIRAALERTSNNQVRAAVLLGVTRDTLRYRLKKFGMNQRARA